MFSRVIYFLSEESEERHPHSAFGNLVTQELQVSQERQVTQERAFDVVQHQEADYQLEEEAPTHSFDQGIYWAAAIWIKLIN